MGGDRLQYWLVPTIQLDQGKTESRLCDRITDTFPGRLGVDVL